MVVVDAVEKVGEVGIEVVIAMGDQQVDVIAAGVRVVVAVVMVAAVGIVVKVVVPVSSTCDTSSYVG